MTEVRKLKTENKDAAKRHSHSPSPIFRLLSSDTDITAAIAGRLLSLTVSDKAGQKSDTAELRLDDRGGHIELPRKGAELDVSLGYEQALVKMGVYVVDELELNSPPATLTIRARAANMRKSLKEHKTRAFDEMTLSALVQTIATEHDLEPRIGETLAAIPIPHIDQTEESDLHLLTRLAKDHDAVAKPAGGYLLFVPRGEAKSATGKTLPALTLTPGDVSDYRVTLADRGRYQAVKANWHNTETGERIEVKVGEGKPVFTLRHTCPDAEQAKAAARGKLDALSRGTATLSLTLKPGNPQVAAESKLTLTGFRDGIDGDWTATQVDHELNDSGYSTRIQAETPKK